MRAEAVDSLWTPASPTSRDRPGCCMHGGTRPSNDNSPEERGGAGSGTVTRKGCASSATPRTSTRGSTTPRRSPRKWRAHRPTRDKDGAPPPQPKPLHHTRSRSLFLDFDRTRGHLGGHWRNRPPPPDTPDAQSGQATGQAPWISCAQRSTDPFFGADDVGELAASPTTTQGKGEARHKLRKRVWGADVQASAQSGHMSARIGPQRRQIPGIRPRTRNALVGWATPAIGAAPGVCEGDGPLKQRRRATWPCRRIVWATCLAC